MENKNSLSGSNFAKVKNFHMPSSSGTNKNYENNFPLNSKVVRNHSRDARQIAGPYHKVNSSSSTASKTTNKLAPIFVRTVNCKSWLISDNRFVVNPSEFHSKLIDVFKTIPSKSYDPNLKIWSFSIKHYDLLHERCELLKPNVVVEKIPKKILNLCLQPEEELDYSCLASIEPTLVESLLPFQKDGVCFGISKHGRVLIADEMGLGKTYQALGIADFYKDDWPLLICTTASTRCSWENHIKNLLPQIACHHIKCLQSNQDYIEEAKILITSYTMLEKHIDKLLEKRFGVLIYDESHTLKNQKAKCTIMADRLAKQAKRVILISGTPALSRPVELFTQLKMLDPSFLNFIDFTTRYCAGKQTNFGWNATGQSNLEELNVLLKKKFMIRRLKTDVLPQLAEKFRETVTLDPTQIRIDSNLNSYADNLSQCKDGRKKEEILLNYYSETAKAKKDAVCNYIQNLVKEKLKFIVFAHHSIMINAICDRLEKLNVNYIRIDGSTKNELRMEYINKFQQNKSCQVAVLSLKACNAGITLTAADLIIFAELDWNPSTLVQAESRAHRIGQEGKVTCRYLIAHKTADDIIWEMLRNKQNVLHKAGIFSENLQNAEFITGPSTNHVIEDFFKPKENVEITDRNEGGIQKINANGKKDEMTSEVNNEDLSALLDDENEIFSNFKF